MQSCWRHSCWRQSCWRRSCWRQSCPPPLLAHWLPASGGERATRAHPQAVAPVVAPRPSCRPLYGSRSACGRTGRGCLACGCGRIGRECHACGRGQSGLVCLASHVGPVFACGRTGRGCHACGPAFWLPSREAAPRSGLTVALRKDRRAGGRKKSGEGGPRGERRDCDERWGRGGRPRANCGEWRGLCAPITPLRLGLLSALLLPPSCWRHSCRLFPTHSLPPCSKVGR